MQVVFRLLISMFPLNIQLSREDWDPITGIASPHMCTCFKLGTEFPTSCDVDFLVFSDLK